MMEQRKKFIAFFVLFFILMIIFNAIMDTIAFHPDSWLVKLAPSFMVIKSSGGLIRVNDGWHVSKLLMYACLILSYYFCIKFSYIDVMGIEPKRLRRFILVLVALVYAVHVLFFNELF